MIAGTILLVIVWAAANWIVQVIRKVALGGIGPIPGTAINLTTALIAFSAIMIGSGHRGIYACRGRTLVYLLSDDNGCAKPGGGGAATSRTRLLVFELVG